MVSDDIIKAIEFSKPSSVEDAIESLSQIKQPSKVYVFARDIPNFKSFSKKKVSLAQYKRTLFQYALNVLKIDEYRLKSLTRKKRGGKKRRRIQEDDDSDGSSSSSQPKKVVKVGGFQRMIQAPHYDESGTYLHELKILADEAKLKNAGRKKFIEDASTYIADQREHFDRDKLKDYITNELEKPELSRSLGVLMSGYKPKGKAKKFFETIMYKSGDFMSVYRPDSDDVNISGEVEQNVLDSVSADPSRVQTPAQTPRRAAPVTPAVTTRRSAPVTPAVTTRRVAPDTRRQSEPSRRQVAPRKADPAARRQSYPTPRPAADPIEEKKDFTVPQPRQPPPASPRQLDFSPLQTRQSRARRSAFTYLEPKKKPRIRKLPEPEPFELDELEMELHLREILREDPLLSDEKQKILAENVFQFILPATEIWNNTDELKKHYLKSSKVAQKVVKAFETDEPKVFISLELKKEMNKLQNHVVKKVASYAKEFPKDQKNWIRSVIADALRNIAITSEGLHALDDPPTQEEGNKDALLTPYSMLVQKISSDFKNRIWDAKKTELEAEHAREQELKLKEAIGKIDEELKAEPAAEQAGEEQDAPEEDPQAGEERSATEEDDEEDDEETDEEEDDEETDEEEDEEEANKEEFYNMAGLTELYDPPAARPGQPPGAPAAQPQQAVGAPAAQPQQAVAAQVAANNGDQLAAERQQAAIAAAKNREEALKSTQFQGNQFRPEFQNAFKQALNLTYFRTPEYEQIENKRWHDFTYVPDGSGEQSYEAERGENVLHNDNKVEELIRYRGQLYKVLPDYEPPGQNFRWCTSKEGRTKQKEPRRPKKNDSSSENFYKCIASEAQFRESDIPNPSRPIKSSVKPSLSMFNDSRNIIDEIYEGKSLASRLRNSKTPARFNYIARTYKN